MPVSPFKRAAQEGLNQPEGDGRSTAGSGKAKRKPKPTSKAKNRKKKVKARYAKAREEAQLAGVIPTTPDGAVRNERVPTAPDPVLPELVRQAIRESWATPDRAKARVVASLLEPFFNNITVVDEEGRALQIPASPKLLNELAKTLRMLDQTQYERDHPEEATKAKGGGGSAAVSVTVQTNIQAAALVREMIERGELGVIEEMQPPDKPSALGGGGQQRQVEADTTSQSDQQRVGESLAHTQQSNGDQCSIPAR